MPVTATTVNLILLTLPAWGQGAAPDIPPVLNPPEGAKLVLVADAKGDLRPRGELVAFSLPLALTLQAQDDLSLKSHAIEELLNAGKFEQAEPLVRECLRQAPHEIHFLSQLEVSLNGQGKRREADDVAVGIRQIWKSGYKKRWIANGSPIAESSWARVMTTSRDYYVIGTEYFMPYLVEGSKTDVTALWADYKVIALPKQKEGRSRIFMLAKAGVERAYFLEEYTGKAIVMVAAYSNKRPDIRDLARTVADYLDRCCK